MKATSIVFSVIACATLALGQQAPTGFYTSFPISYPGDARYPSIQPIISSATPLPMWNYNVTTSADLGGGSFSGTILGRSPYSRGKTTTGIPTQLIPLVITITDGHGAITYDPTQVDTCASPPTLTDVQIITGSPIFQNNNWTMNVPVGNTQYIDAFQRAEFWSLVQNTPYHLILNETTLGSQPLSFNSTQASNFTASDFASFNPCGGAVGVVNIDVMDAAIKALITGPLAATVNVGTFPIFLTKDVFMAFSGHSIFANCCVLGYHSAFTVGSNAQIYSPFSLDTSGAFGGDVSTLAHEMGEAVDDPLGNNPTPIWGNIGQVQNGTNNACQNNFEVGDPLSPGFPGSPPQVTVLGGNGFLYHLQDLAFFSWFYGTPSIGSGGKFSAFGNFSGDMKLGCASGGGGTN
jgi:hypothetical protein